MSLRSLSMSMRLTSATDAEDSAAPPFSVALRQRFFVLLGAARQSVGAVLQRREIQMRRDFLLHWRNVGLFRIGAGRECAFVDLEVALANLILLLCREGLQPANVGLDGVR